MTPDLPEEEEEKSFPPIMPDPEITEIKTPTRTEAIEALTSGATSVVLPKAPAPPPPPTIGPPPPKEKKTKTQKEKKPVLSFAEDVIRKVKKLKPATARVLKPKKESKEEEQKRVLLEAMTRRRAGTKPTMVKQEVETKLEPEQLVSTPIIEIPTEPLLKFKTFDELKKESSQYGVNQMKALISSYQRLLKAQSSKEDYQKNRISTIISAIKKANLEDIYKEFLQKFLDSDLFDIVYKEPPSSPEGKPRLPIEVEVPALPVASGEGMKKTMKKTKKKPMKKPKQNRRPSKWILEIKDVMQKEGLSYGEGMKRASQIRKGKK